jgi:xylulokinase
MSLVAGVDSSTQSCKVVIRDAETGGRVRDGTARHPDGTEVDPEAWWVALQAAIADAGGIDDVDAIAVGGQQHGMVQSLIHISEPTIHSLISYAVFWG